MKLMRLGLAAILAFGLLGNSVAPDRSDHDYGTLRRQSLSIYQPPAATADAPRRPLILFIHGGGWTSGSKKMGEGGLPAHFTSHGYVWAAMDYRLVPSGTVEEQLGDVARAIRWLRRKADRFGIDPDQIVLIGHSSGGHLAAMIGSDPHWLETAGVPFGAVRAVVSLDGAALDLDAMMKSGAGVSPYYGAAFGKDQARWAVLSPTAHAAAPNVPHWLLLFDADHNSAGGVFARRLAERLTSAGAVAEAAPVNGTTHMRMLREASVEGSPTATIVDRFLDNLLRADGESPR